MNVLLHMLFPYLTALPLSQGKDPVILWGLSAERVGSTEFIVSISGNALPGWYIASNDSDGKEINPAVEINFAPSDEYAFTGILINQTPYKSRSVSTTDYCVVYSQRIRLIKSSTLVSGKINYLACHERYCVAQVYDFSLTVSLTDQ